MTGRLIGISISALVFGVICSSPCTANDAQDAVELLTYALKCANEPIRLDWAGGAVFMHSIERYIGDAYHLIVEDQTTFDDGTRKKSTIRVNFSDLDTPHINAGRMEGSTLSLYCSSPHLGCMTIETNGERVDGMRSVDLTLCDATAVAQAKLAIDTLIELNRLNAGALAPAAGGPDLTNSDIFKTLDIGNVGKGK